MATVPYDEGIPSVLPRTEVPEDYQRINPTPAAFGAAIGQGLERAGAGATSAAKTYEEVSAQQLANQFEDESNKLVYGDPSKTGADGSPDRGLLGTRGEDALTAQASVRQKILDLRDQYKGQLFSSDQELLFNNETSYAMRRLLSTIGAHYDSQFNTYQEGVNNARFAGASDLAASAPKDPQALEAAFDKARSAATDQVRLKYGANASQDLIDEAVSKANAAVTERSIESLLTSQDPRDLAFAQKALQSPYGQLLKGPRYDALDQKLQSKLTDIRAKGAADDAIHAAYGGNLPAVAPGGAVAPPQIPRADFEQMGRQAAAKYGVPWEIFSHQIMGESNWNPGVANSGVGPNGGAKGIAQFQDETAQKYGVNVNDVPSSLEGAAHYMADLHQQGGSWQAALAGYLTGNPNPAEVKSVTATNPSYATAYANARAIDQGGPGRPAQPGKFDLGAGDSIGFGFQSAAGLPGSRTAHSTDAAAPDSDAAGGRNPQDNLAYIEAHPEKFAGKTVLWSSGLMNGDLTHYAPEFQLQFVGRQLDALKAAGATPVLAGVDTGKFAPYNAQLAQIAQQHGVPFAGPLPTNDVHPSPQGYKDYAQKAAQLIAAPQGTDQVVGAQPAPAAVQPGQPPGIEKTMTLAGMFRHIEAMNLPIDTEFKAKALARQNYDAIESDYNRQQLQDAKAQKQLLDQAITKYQQDAFSDQPKFTAKDVVNDPAFQNDPELRTRVLDFMANPPGTGLPAAVSYRNALGLLDRIRLPYGNDQKITDMSQILDNAHSLNKADFEFVQKQFNEVMTPGGEKLAARRAKFFEDYGPQIDHSNPLMGKIDESGKSQRYLFEYAVDQKMDELRAANKNPGDALDPAKPDFMGKPEAIAPYQKTLQQSLQDKTRALTGAASANTPAPTSVTPQRQPGETIQDYMKRVGGGILPGLMPQPAASAPLER
jgi:hypothetical protein